MTTPSLMSPEPRTSRYLRKPGTRTIEYEIFLSSGSDLIEYRDLFEQMARTFSEQAADGGVRYRIHVRRWESAISRKTDGDGNREFRHDARHAHLVVVLLHKDLRNGTKEELEAAVSASETQVAILWIDAPDRSKTRKREAKKLYLALDELRDEVRWESVSSAERHAIALKMAAILARVLVDISARPDSPEESYSESR
ncbi:hypothetical protein [Gordonia sp. NPDC127522]|uniref:hypothetical protein n=1 Tax=Gordonia sp. NPDC127522 TaxID=3345390 RepID=UPI0036299795